jgi:Tfp pilus assembly protein PilN
MAQQNQRAPDVTSGDNAMATVNAVSKNMQAIASEIFEISKQSFEHTTQTLEKLRNAHGMEEVLAIQTSFVKEAFENSAQHAKKFSELLGVLPSEITKTYQDAWLKSLNSLVQTTETATQTAAENVDRLSDTMRKTSSVFDKSA